MTTSVTTPTLSDPACVKATDSDHLTQLLETHRRVTSELYAKLQILLTKESGVYMNPPPQVHTNRVQQLQKAFELYRQAEAKIELLVLHFGGLL